VTPDVCKYLFAPPPAAKDGDKIHIEIIYLDRCQARSVVAPSYTHGYYEEWVWGNKIVTATVPNKIFLTIEAQEIFSAKFAIEYWYEYVEIVDDDDDDDNGNNGGDSNNNNGGNTNNGTNTNSTDGGGTNNGDTNNGGNNNGGTDNGGTNNNGTTGNTTNNGNQTDDSNGTQSNSTGNVQINPYVEE